MNSSFWKSGHTPTLFSAFLYFYLSFMVWYLLGPLAVQIAADLHLTTQQRGLVVATPILDVAMARFESDQALRAQLFARDQQLAERKRIELAKGLLMKMKACNEEQAYTLMRRQAMSRQQKLIQVAEQIIAMSELLE